MLRSFATFVLVASLSNAGSAAAVEERRVLGPVDLVRFANIGDPATHHDVAVSPDGSYALVVVTRGNPDALSNDGELLLFDLRALNPTAAPARLASFSSLSNHPPISSVRWAADSKSAYFVGASDADHAQIFQVTLRGASKRLTSFRAEARTISRPLPSYAVSRDGGVLATVRSPAWNPPIGDPVCMSKGCRLASVHYPSAEWGMPTGSDLLELTDLTSGTSRTLADPKDVLPGISRCQGSLLGELSPDGRYAFRVCDVTEFPASWAEYSGSDFLTTCINTHSFVCGQAIVQVDLTTGAQSRVEVGPYLFDAAPIWVSNTEVVFPGIRQDLGSSAGKERASRRSRLAVLSYDPLSKATKRLAWLPEKAKRVEAARWNARSRNFSIDARDVEERRFPVAFREWRGGWINGTFEPVTAGPLMISVRQDYKTRPVLIAHNARLKTEIELLDPNTWLDEFSVGIVEPISWKLKSGRTWTGGIYYPPGYQPGKKYPLLIQTHFFQENKFSLDGAGPNFAAQATAAQNIVVLQVSELLGSDAGKATQWRVAQDGYESAIDELSRRGLIDPKRVAVQGWSFTGPTVGYFLTHSEYPVAAAAYTSTGDYGWWNYVWQGAPQLHHAQYDAAPFGRGLKAWLEESPSFNLDRVRTPIFMWSNGSAGGLWEWYAPLRRLGVPAEAWVFPDGEHELFKVGERIRANSLLVDWYSFWLTGSIRGSADDPDRLKRWHEYKTEMEALDNVQRPPLLEWTARLKEEK